MARPPASTNAEIIAAISQMEEQINTLQRERRDDREAVRAEVAELKSMLLAGIDGLKADLTTQLAPLKSELKPLTELRQKGVGFLAAAGLAGTAFGYVFVDEFIAFFKNLH